MRVYHFTPHKYAVQSIQKQHLKLALLDDMNDPFELMPVEAKTKADRQFFNELKADLHEKIGVLCLSKDWHNPVMWSHYADRHFGTCLGFDAPDENLQPISYSTGRLAAELEDKDPNIAMKLITTKFKHWQYEQETRILYHLYTLPPDAKGRYFAPYDREDFPKLLLREVILGPRSQHSVDAVRAWVQKKQPQAQVFRARLSFKTYRVVTDLRTVAKAEKK